MTITTQDGRKLVLKKGDKVKFEAGLYCGRVQRGYVAAEIRPVGFENVTYKVTLGEYEAPKGREWSIAEKAARAVREAFEHGVTEHYMLGYKADALDDNLMTAIALLDTLYAQIGSKGWYLEFGMINGDTNYSYYINPDNNGSYFDSVRACYYYFQKEPPMWLGGKVAKETAA